VHWEELVAPTPDVLVPGGHHSTFSQSVLGKGTYVPCGVKMQVAPSKQAPTEHCAAAGVAYPIKQPSRNTTMVTGRADECFRTMRGPPNSRIRYAPPASPDG